MSKRIYVALYNLLRIFIFLRTSDYSLYSDFSSINLFIIQIISANDWFTQMFPLQLDWLRCWLLVFFVIDVWFFVLGRFVRVNVFVRRALWVSVSVLSSSHRSFSATLPSKTQCSRSMIAYSPLIEFRLLPLWTFLEVEGVGVLRLFDIVFKTPFWSMVNIRCWTLTVRYGPSVFCNYFLSVFFNLTVPTASSTISTYTNLLVLSTSVSRKLLHGRIYIASTRQSIVCQRFLSYEQISRICA